MTDEDEVRRRFARALQRKPTRVAKLPSASKLALPQPATLAVFTHMSSYCQFRCGRHETCCAHPGKAVQEYTGSCQFAHCPLMKEVLNA